MAAISIERLIRARGERENLTWENGDLIQKIKQWKAESQHLLILKRETDTGRRDREASTLEKEEVGARARE